MLKAIHSYEFSQIKCLDDDNIINVEKKFDKFLLNNNYNYTQEFLNNEKNKGLPKLNFDLNKLSQYFKNESSSKEFVTIETDLKNFNEYFNSLSSLIHLQDLTKFELLRVGSI